jgi:Tetratricopeptide repeat
MGNLAAILWQEGDLAEAYELQRQVVELRRRIHGDADQATLIAAAVLETMERDTGF